MTARHDATLTDQQIEEIDARVLATYDGRAQISSIAAEIPGFDLVGADRVCVVVRGAREARGERAIGRKLCFTNRNIWDEYKVYAPIWNYVYDTTVRTVSTGGMAATGDEHAAVMRLCQQVADQRCHRQRRRLRCDADR